MFSKRSIVRYALWCIALLCSGTGFGQTILSGEYFIDTDTGPGTGTLITVAGDGSILENISPGALAPGPHTLCTRFITDELQWSGSRCIPFVVGPPQENGAITITTAEYFIDTDNGPGTGNPVMVVNGAVSDILQVVNGDGLDAGPHHLCYRVRNNNGVWGGSYCMNFFVANENTSADITACEYFFDTDNGPGTGMPVAVVANGMVNIDELVAVNSLSPGIHRLCLRFRSSYGNWSGSRCLTLFVEAHDESVAIITDAEYFLDNDPGPGNGSSVDITQDLTTSITESISTNSVSQGVHKLCYRLKDNTGRWSGAKCMDVYVSPAQDQVLPEIVAAEYFIGDDPGQGNGISIDVDDASIVQLSEDISLDGLPEGTYVISVRFMSQAGEWSIAESQEFVICGSGPPVASFGYTLETFDIILNNTSQYSTGNTWNLEDDESTDVNPVFSVPGPGAYEVCLAVENNCGEDEHCEVIIVPDTLQIVNVWPGEIVPGETFNVEFSANYINFSAGNIFTLQLSGTDGTYNNPLELATLNSTTSGTFTNVDIPLNLPPNCYGLRIVSSSPAFASHESTLKVNHLAAANPANYALRFDGIDDYANFGPMLGDHDFTLSFWVKPDSTQVGEPVVADMQHDFVLYENPNTEGNYVLSHLLQFDMLPGKWNHVTITMDNQTSQRKVYLFGQLVDQNTWNYNPWEDYDFIFGHGNSFSNDWFSGYLDELKLWNYTMGEDEVFAAAHSTIAGDEPGVLAYYSFDDGCTNIAEDNSPFAQTANLYGGTQHVVSDIPEFSNFVVPDHGGNNGFITLHISGEYFTGIPTVKLLHETYPEIVADTAYYNSTQDMVTALFNLTGTSIGLYDVMVITSDTTNVNYPLSFTIEESIAGGIEVSILGRNTIRAGGVHTFFIVYENTSNNDMRAPVTVLESYADDYIGYDDQDLFYQFQRLPLILGNMHYDLPQLAYTTDSTISPGIQYVIPIKSVTGIGGSRDNCEDMSRYNLQFPLLSNPGNPFDHVLPNGCSNPEFALNRINNFLSWDYVQSITVNWNEEFEDPCNRHDTCYQLCYSPMSQHKAKTICDLQLYQQLSQHCSSSDLSPGIDPEICQSAAALYYLGVHVFGSVSAFDMNQLGCTIYQLLPGSSPESEVQYVPDCDHCPPNAICFATNRISSYDPNEKAGPDRYQNLDNSFEYSIYFENADSASASAQRVMVIDTLNPAYYDFNSFQFLGFGFDDELKFIPQDQPQQFTVDTDLRPGKNLVVRTNGYFDPATGIATWDFTSLDPLTMQLTEEVELGFLDPNDSTGRGQGLVYFMVNPLPGLETGDSISNRASIYFDFNPPIVTDDWLNTIDLVAPWSNVMPLEEVQDDSTFTVSWTGADTLISAIDHYTIYVSENGGPYYVLVDIAYDTSLLFTGHNGSSYAFYSLAIDSAGNVESAPIIPDAVTLINVVFLPAVFSVEISQPQCSYSDNAFITAGILHGHPPFSFTWDETVLNDTLYGATPGEHHLVITDATSATILDTTLVIVAPLPLTYDALLSDANCFGSADGSAVVMAYGGTGDYVFDWEGADPDQLSAGNYHFTITDENDCNLEGEVIITEPSAVNIEANTIPASSDEACDGSIELELSGGSPPYLVEWNTTATGEVLTDACAGEYSATITDDHGCINETTLLTIPLGVFSNYELHPELIISPNPSRGRFDVVMKTGSDRIEWKVYDASGRRVAMDIVIPSSLHRFEWWIDLTAQADGSYVLEISEGENLIRRKLIVARE